MNDRQTTAIRREPVLVVDDDPVSLELLSRHLAAAGHEPILAESSGQALSIISERGTQIIVCDWLMPGMNGLELCREIRSRQADRFVYFIMLTIQSDKDRLLEAFDAGVDDFLSKPFHKGELLARMRAGTRLMQLYSQLNERQLATNRLNAELSRLNNKLQQMANTDALTGLLNRRQALRKLREQWAHAERYSRPLSSAMVDIDHFKRINDEYGHLKGDEVLQRIGSILAQAVRAADFVCRIGGEEFLILFPEQTVDQASVSAERCRALVESEGFALQGRSESVTVSIGIAEQTKKMTGPDDLLKAADSCLYSAKGRGRNRVVFDRPPGAGQTDGSDAPAEHPAAASS